MRLPKKEINVFSVSAIDIFASAMGAFLLLTAVILPFYPNISDEVPRRRSDFMAGVMIIKTTCVDVDLHVVEEFLGQRNHYYWKDKQPNGNLPGLSLDHRRGIGTEIWELEAIKPGATYTFMSDFFERNSNSSCASVRQPYADIELRLYHNAGFTKLDNIRVAYDSQIEPLLRVTTDNSGEFTIEQLAKRLNGVQTQFSGARSSIE